MIRRMLILGATGDLTFRHLLPALTRLLEAGKLPDRFEGHCLGRDDQNTEAFRSSAEERLAKHAPDVPEAARRELVEALRYHRADVTDPGQVKAALRGSGEPVIA